MRRALYIGRYLLTLVGAWFLLSTTATAVWKRLQPRTHWTACIVHTDIDGNHYRLSDIGKCKEGTVTLDVDVQRQAKEPAW